MESSKGKTVGKNVKKSYVSPQNGEEKCSTVASLSRSDGRAARVEGVRSLAWSLATQESGAHISSDTPIRFHCASLLFVQLQLALKLRECILKCFQFLHSVLTFTYVGKILFSFVLTLLLIAQRVLMPTKTENYGISPQSLTLCLPRINSRASPAMKTTEKSLQMRQFRNFQFPNSKFQAYVTARTKF